MGGAEGGGKTYRRAKPRGWSLKIPVWRPGETRFSEVTQGHSGIPKEINKKDVA